MENKDCEIEKLKEILQKANDRISELSVQNAQYHQRMVDAEGNAREARNEKDKMLSIIADLSKGIANLKA